MTHRFIAPIIVFFLVAAGLTAQQDVPSGDSTAEPDRVRELLGQHVEVLSQLAELTRRAFEHGDITLEAVIRADDQLLQAQIESANNSRARLALYEERLELARQRESQIRRRVEVGELEYTEQLQAKSDRLKIAIALQRLREAPAGSADE